MVIAVVAIAAWAWPSPPPDMESVTAPVRVEGPDGLIWNGTVQAPGTAFHVLVAASEAGDFPVEWSGPEGQRFVHTIDGIDSRNGGWCVQVDGADSPTFVERHTVRDGQSVRWYWVPDNCERF